MTNFQIDYENLVVHVMPDDALSERDFETLEAAVAPVIESAGSLNGIIIEMESFPGWEDFSALTRHVRFIHDHHDRVHRVAIVANHAAAKVMEKLGEHFVAAEVRRFDRDALDEARGWVCEARMAVVC